MQLVVCGVRRPVHLEGSTWSLGDTRQHEPPRSKSVSIARDTARNVRQLDQCAQALGNQQKDGDSPVNMVVQGFLEKSRLKTRDELRRFITVDNHEAVKVGDLERSMESRPVVKLKFTTAFTEAVVREGSDELTLRREEEGVLRTSHRHHECGRQWGPPPVDEDWHATCQANIQGVGRSAWETMFHNHQKLHKPVKRKTSRRQRNSFHDLGSVQKINSRSQVTLALCAIHLRSPTALADALKRADQKCGPAQSPAASVASAMFLESEAFGSFVLWLAHRARCARCAMADATAADPVFRNRCRNRRRQRQQAASCPPACEVLAWKVIVRNSARRRCASCSARMPWPRRNFSTFFWPGADG